MSKENIDNKSEDKKLYELGFHVISSIPEGKISDEVENLKASLKKVDANAEIVKESEGGAKLIDLAYEITKKINEVNERFDKAYFGWIKFNTTAEGAESLKSELDNNTNILRYLLVKTVDDDEHSTAKIALDEEEKKESEDKKDNKSDDNNNTKDAIEADAKAEAEKDAKNSGEKSVDEAIDELVE